VETSRNGADVVGLHFATTNPVYVDGGWFESALTSHASIELQLLLQVDLERFLHVMQAEEGDEQGACYQDEVKDHIPA